MPKVNGKYLSSSKERIYQIVLTPREFAIIEGIRMGSFLRGKSEQGKIIVSHFISSIPEEKQKKLIDDYYYHINKNKKNKQP